MSEVTGQATWMSSAVRIMLGSTSREPDHLIGIVRKGVGRVAVQPC